MTTVRALPFYSEWAGHPIPDLITAHAAITAAVPPDHPIIYLAGDSSLDNKAWVPSTGPGGDPLPCPVPQVYHKFLSPPTPKPDVAFFLNHVLDGRASVINAAVEASLLRQRHESLLPHDEFIRDRIQKKDFLIVSVGANDIALSPSPSTIRHMLQLAWLTPKSSIEQGTASSLPYFRGLFRKKTEVYIRRLVEKCKPRAVLVCAIYYPLEASASTQSSWADSQLRMLGYGKFPEQLQAAIRQIYESATAKIEIDGTSVAPCPLFEVMGGKIENDYVARVEPSVAGGRKMADLLSAKLEPFLARSS